MPKRELSTKPAAVKARKQRKLRNKYLLAHKHMAEQDIGENFGKLIPWEKRKKWATDPVKYELRGVDYFKKGRALGSRNKSQRITNAGYEIAIKAINPNAKTSGKTRKQLQSMMSRVNPNRRPRVKK